jgi:hypothetical protein
LGQFISYIEKELIGCDSKLQEGISKFIKTFCKLCLRIGLNNFILCS